MYHLLVKHDGWRPAQDRLDLSRVFEYTERAVTESFKPDGILDAAKIAEIPALFMREDAGDGSELAHLGYIVRARTIGNVVELDYAMDPAVAPISAGKLLELSSELDIVRFEFSRTHWAIKDVDLFRVLLRNQPIRKFKSAVFEIPDDTEVDNRLVSVMMPFDLQFNGVYVTLKRTAASLGLECLRADDIWEHDAIIQDIVSLIARSKVIICDCTGRNANVFYEIGIAHALGKNVILITQHATDIPFDLRHLRYVTYLNNREGLDDLSTKLQTRLETLTR